MSDQPRVKIVCPECGGPLPEAAANVAVTCPQCGHASAPGPREPVVERTVVVERVVVTASSTASAGPPCPRCKVGLFEGDAHGVRLLGCAVCGGIFLDNEGSTRIVRAHDSLIAQLAERAKSRAVVPGVDTRPKDLPCPICAQVMQRARPKKCAEIDFCSTHGTWFDRGELNAIMNAYGASATVDADARARAAAEVRMAEFRQSQTSAIAAAESASEVGAFGITMGLLGILGALAGGSRA